MDRLSPIFQVTSELATAHQIDIKSLIILTSSIKLVGSTLPKEKVDVLVEKLLPLLNTKVNYTNVVDDDQNLFIIAKEEFVFIFIVN